MSQEDSFAHFQPLIFTHYMPCAHTDKEISDGNKKAMKFALYLIAE